MQPFTLTCKNQYYHLHQAKLHKGFIAQENSYQYCFLCLEMRLQLGLLWLTLNNPRMSQLALKGEGQSYTPEAWPHTKSLLAWIRKL